jgi:excisionase family DNA binding protein
MSEPQTITVEEAGRRLGVSRNTAYAAARDGTIPTIRLGHRLVVPIIALQKLLDGGQVATATPKTGRLK